MAIFRGCHMQGGKLRYCYQKDVLCSRLLLRKQDFVQWHQASDGAVGVRSAVLPLTTLSVFIPYITNKMLCSVLSAPAYPFSRTSHESLHYTRINTLNPRMADSPPSVT